MASIPSCTLPMLLMRPLAALLACWPLLGTTCQPCLLRYGWGGPDMGSCPTETCPFDDTNSGSGGDWGTKWTCNSFQNPCTPRDTDFPDPQNELIGFAIHMEKLHTSVIPPGNTILKDACWCQEVAQLQNDACDVLAQAQDFILKHYDENFHSAIYGPPGTIGEFVENCVIKALELLTCS